VLNDAEAGFSFVENQQTLATSGEQHEVGFPMTGRLAAFDRSRTFGDRAPLFDELAELPPGRRREFRRNSRLIVDGARSSADASCHFSQTKFAVVPELSLKAGSVNPSLAPPGPPTGPIRPLPVLNTTNLLAHGFSFGVRYDY
jgi:hypothetical protein